MSKKISLSHPLKGILNTNDDPLRCAVCLVALPVPIEGSPDIPALYLCCGKEICRDCNNALRVYDPNQKKCLMCNATNIGGNGVLKKNAKTREVCKLEGVDGGISHRFDPETPP